MTSFGFRYSFFFYSVALKGVAVCYGMDSRSTDYCHASSEGGVTFGLPVRYRSFLVDAWPAGCHKGASAYLSVFSCSIKRAVLITMCVL